MAQEKWLIDGEKIIDIEMVRKIKVGLIGGLVNIVGHDVPGARVEVHSVRGTPPTVTIDGDTLEIDQLQLGWDNFIEVFKSFRGSASADISIMVPRDVELKFGVVTASGLLSRLTEDSRISTVSGDVVIDNHSGDLELNAVSGEISVRNHTGRIVAHTVSGDLTASGAIRSFTSNGVFGNVFLDIHGIPDLVRINTLSVVITARLEPGVPVHYKIKTVSGTLQLDDSESRGVRGGYTGTFGALEKQWLEFRANTVSGDVSVLPAVSA